MKLIEYMPQFLKEVREFKEIFNCEDEELNFLRNLIDRMITEVIVKTATIYGIERYEKIYKITDIASTIEGRRANILLKMNNNNPYTKKWLEKLLDTIIGQDNYTLTIDTNSYSVFIDVSLSNSSILESLRKQLAQEIPANLKLQYNFYTDINLFVAAVIIEENEIITIDTIPNESIKTLNLEAKGYIGYVLEEQENINL